jgi:hypothetical protein
MNSNHPLPEADRFVLQDGYPETEKEKLRELIRTHADLQEELTHAVAEAERVCKKIEANDAA